MLFAHFADKQELFLVSIAEVQAEVGRRICESIVAGRHRVERVPNAIALFRLVCASGNQVPALFEQWTACVDRPVRNALEVAFGDRATMAFDLLVMSPLARGAIGAKMSSLDLERVLSLLR